MKGKRAIWVIALPVALVAMLPAAAEAASYRFKVDLSVVQTTDWAQTVRHPAPGDGYCGTATSTTSTRARATAG